MARLVYTGDKIKQHAGGYSFTRGVPKEIPIESLDSRSREQIETDPDIGEAKSKKAGPTDIEVVLDTPDYEPLEGHQMPTPVRKKAARKRGKK